MKPIIFGHRGIPSLATENSLKSFNLILDYNIEGVELDIHLTKDGQLVVIHDFNTLEMTGVNKVVSNSNFDDLSRLNIDKEQKIPLLRDVFSLLNSRVIYDLEIKSDGKNRKQLTLSLLNLIKEFKLEKNCLISSFNPLIIRSFNSLKSGIPTALIYVNDKSYPLLLRHGFGLLLCSCKVIKPHYKQLQGPLFFIYTKILKKICYTWTVDTTKEFNIAKKAGSKGVCTNYPQKFN